MRFNPDPKNPAEEIIFSHKRTCQVHQTLFFINIQVKQVNDHKHLGLTLDSKLTFVNQISEKVCKTLKGVGVIKYLSSYVLTNILEQMYKMYIQLYLVMLNTMHQTFVMGLWCRG